MSKRKYYGDPAVNNNNSEKGVGYCLWCLFKNSCVIYTTAVLLLALLISAVATGEDEGIVFFFDLVMLYPLAFVIACANMLLFKNKTMNFWARFALHALIILSATAVYLLTVKQYEMNSIVTLMPAFIVMYAIFMAVVLWIRHLKKKHEKENGDYSDVYANVKSNIRGK